MKALGLLRHERARAHLTQRELAAAAGLHVHTVELLEVGWRRPSTVATWRLARALRPNGTLRDRVAADERLRQAAGSALRFAATRPHRRREAVREQLLAEADVGVVLGDHDETLGGALVAELSRMFDSTPATQPDEAR
jgi:DNA-binding XRE family transcriptional regulator